MKVADLMHTDLKTIGVDATIGDAVEVLAEAQVSAVPVIDRFGRAVGVISTRDILNAESTFAGTHARDMLFDHTRVLEIMSAWPPTIGPEISVQEAAKQMLYLDVQRLFVETEGALVGVVSQSDIVAAVARAKT
ncbi:MAG TPA: CBS domain-containing protein [Gemmatimonadales bacterium]|nr:CBS domain-containing protein [Gemmatimonadales bacterium]